MHTLSPFVPGLVFGLIYIYVRTLVRVHVLIHLGHITQYIVIQGRSDLVRGWTVTIGGWVSIVGVLEVLREPLPILIEVAAHCSDAAKETTAGADYRSVVGIGCHSWQ